MTLIVDRASLIDSILLLPFLFNISIGEIDVVQNRILSPADAPKYVFEHTPLSIFAKVSLATVYGTMTTHW